jgi:hypothetical protein
MSNKILTVEGGQVKEHEVRSDGEINSEDLHKALSKFMGVDADKTAANMVITSIGAIEYACIVSNQVGVERDAFLESVTNVWDRVSNTEGGTIREQG